MWESDAEIGFPTGSDYHSSEADTSRLISAPARNSFEEQAHRSIGNDHYYYPRSTHSPRTLPPRGAGHVARRVLSQPMAMDIFERG